MAGIIGHSTGAETADGRADTPGPEVASFRYCNPGAQYPSADAARFGQVGYGIIGNGRYKITRFPSPANGAAANFNLLYRSYTGMTIGVAGQKWTGALDFDIPGYPSDQILSRDMLEDAASAIALLCRRRRIGPDQCAAIAHRAALSGGERWQAAAGARQRRARNDGRQPAQRPQERHRHHRRRPDADPRDSPIRHGAFVHRGRSACTCRDQRHLPAHLHCPRGLGALGKGEKWLSN